MCNFKNWFYEEIGYIVQCEKCSHFQLSFGNVILTIKNADYQTFFDVVCYKHETHIEMSDLNVKCVVLPTPCKDVRIVLSQRELNQLYYMVQEADNEMKAQQLLALFSEEEG